MSKFLKHFNYWARLFSHWWLICIIIADWEERFKALGWLYLTIYVVYLMVKTEREILEFELTTKAENDKFFVSYIAGFFAWFIGLAVNTVVSLVLINVYKAFF